MPPTKQEQKKEYRRKYTQHWREEHRAHFNQYSREYRQRNRATTIATLRRYWRKVKEEVLTHYSVADYPICAYCGITDTDILCIDHINGGGTKHIKSLQVHGTNFHHWLRKRGYPEGYQVLCYNCNIKKFRTGGKMKEIPISEFRKMTAPQIREGGSFNVISDGEFVCIVIVPASAEKKFQFESLAELGNAGLGFKE